jgi:hypothetical protein
MVWYAAWQLARVHVRQGRSVTAAGYLYWLMDYEAEYGYRYTTPQTEKAGHRYRIIQPNVSIQVFLRHVMLMMNATEHAIVAELFVIMII